MRKELLEHRFNHSAWLALHERVVNLRNALMLTDLRLLKEKQDSRSVHDLTSLAVVTSRLIEEILNESDVLKASDERGRGSALAEESECKIELLSHVHGIILENGVFRQGLNDLYQLLYTMV